MTARTFVPAAALLCLLALCAAPAGARVVKGVDLPDTLEAGGRTLTLQGAGVRTKWFFSVYVGALYLSTPTSDAAAAVAAAEPKRMELRMLRGVDGEKIAEAIEEGFFNNSQGRLSELRARIDRMKALFAGKLEEGRRISFTYEPDVGTRVAFDGVEKLVLGGADFMEGLWAIWLGEIPADHDLKEAMLGR